MKETVFPTAAVLVGRFLKSKLIPKSQTLLVAIALLASVLPVCAQGGTVVAWGDNRAGQADVPAGLSDVVAIAAGEWHNIALKADGSVVAWGYNAGVPWDVKDVVTIGTGGYHNFAILADGTLKAWGANDYGQINIPAGLSNVVSAKGGWTHSVALKADGTVVAWGRNQEGQANVPAGLNNVVAISIGEYHNLALRSDGSVVGWGWNGYGQATIPPSLGNDVIAISAGGLHSLALKRDGTVVAWGWNQHGQATVPAGLSNVVAIAGAIEHSLALKSDGTVVGWGANDGWASNDPNCQFIGAPCERKYTGQIDVPPGLNNVVAIAGGVFHSIALTAGEAVPAPSAPTLSIGAVGDTSVTLSWSDLPNETGYRLEARNGASGTWANLAILGANATSYQHAGIPGGTTMFYRLRAFNTGGTSPYSAEVSATTTLPAEAMLVGSDDVTAGAWQGIYGADGGLAPLGNFVVPDYVKISALYNYSYTWENPSTRPAALEKRGGSERFATRWEFANSIYFFLNITDGKKHRVSFYFHDFEALGRQQRIEFYDENTLRFLGGTDLANFEQGLYSTWDLKGKVRVKISRLGSASTVMSAIFFDPIAPAPPVGATTATFVQVDDRTSGAWKGIYGREGGIAPYSDFIYPTNLSIRGRYNYPFKMDELVTQPGALERRTSQTRLASRWDHTSSMYFYLHFSDTAVHRVSFYFWDFDQLGRQQKIEVYDDESNRFLGASVVARFEDGVYSTWDLKGKIRVKVTGFGAGSTVANAIFLDPVAPALASGSTAARFLEEDWTSGGSWIGKYGSDGGLAPYSDFQWPSNVQVSGFRNYPFIWENPSTRQEALQKRTGGSRFATRWQSTNEMYFSLNFTDMQAHRVSFYFYDLDDADRRQKLEFFDETTGQLLGATVIRDFSEGMYSTWELKGKIRVKLTNFQPGPAIMSGIFFDPDTRVNNVRFLGSNTVTSGNWKGNFGTEGYFIAAVASSAPAFASVTTTGKSDHIWNSSTTDLAALQKPTSEDRIASTWYAPENFDVRVDIADGAAHRISFYLLDWDVLHRTQRIEALDAVTGEILHSIDASNFGDGAYLSYDLKGSVRFRMIRTGPANAVVSGVFFDPSSAPF